MGLSQQKTVMWAELFIQYCYQYCLTLHLETLCHLISVKRLGKTQLIGAFITNNKAVDFKKKELETIVYSLTKEVLAIESKPIVDW